MLCKVCGIEKDITDFYVDNRAKNKRRYLCKPCDKERNLQYKPRGFNSWAEYKSDRFKKIYATESGRIAHNKRINDYYHKHKNEPAYKIRKNMRNLLYCMVRSGKDGRNWNTIVGYSTKELMDHLEKKFDDKMSWENYGSYWHIDHIIPVSFFKNQSIESEEFKRCWSLDNLQPLEAKENIRKSNKM